MYSIQYMYIVDCIYCWYCFKAILVIRVLYTVHVLIIDGFMCLYMCTVGIDVKLSWFGKLLETLVSSTCTYTQYSVCVYSVCIVCVCVCRCTLLLDN